MKLYFAAGTSSQAPHIASREVGLVVKFVRVNLQTKATSEGHDFVSINPLGYVPLLELDDGRTLREVPSILLFLAQRGSNKNLARVKGRLDRLHLAEWLSFLSSEIHQGLRSLKRAETVVEANRARLRLDKRFTWIDLQLVGNGYLLPVGYSVADIYLWVLSNWAQATWIDSVLNLDLDLTRFANMRQWHKVIAQRDAVQAALAFEQTHSTLGGRGRNGS